ncbi:MAG: hypothetical protein RIQ93_1581 [Verrucomicrobiota bacterium]|jgi:hypothetical protein
MDVAEWISEGYFGSAARLGKVRFRLAGRGEAAKNQSPPSHFFMNPREFFINASDYGLPTRDELVAYRIWDTHFHGFLGRPSEDPIALYEQNQFYVERMGIERSIALDIGRNAEWPEIPTGASAQEWARLDQASAQTPVPHEAGLRRILERDKDRLSGLVRIDARFPEGSCARMEKWIRNGPCIGIKYEGGNAQGITCDHPNNDRIIRLAVELEATIYIHTWFAVGGTPRLPGGGNAVGESTPLHVANLARRFPDVRMICGHAGGDWELGIRAIRPFQNVLLEFSGSDPHSGSVDRAMAQLGVDRIVWGAHGPLRSYATELAKVLDADLSRDDRVKILGGNYRKYAAPIFRRKGMRIEV